MILTGPNPFREPLDGVDPENRDFLGPEMARGRGRGGGFSLLTSPSLAHCTEQFRNQQRYEKCVRYASGT
jgi:hypothetical protein